MPKCYKNGLESFFDPSKPYNIVIGETGTSRDLLALTLSQNVSDEQYYTSTKLSDIDRYIVDAASNVYEIRKY